MKTNLSRKVIALILSSILLLTCSLPAYAVESFGSFSGQITAPNDIDPSGIEIQVYSAVPVYDESNINELLYYAETYEFSVYADEEGRFDFNKPAQYCSVSVVLDTLPTNYGISKQTQFIIPTNTEMEFELSPVDSVDVSKVDGNIVPTIYDVEGNKILASYTVVPSNSYTVSSAVSTSSSALSLETINAVSAYHYTGNIRIGSELYSYLIEDDLSSMALIDKINFLSAENYLTESEKISLYCDILTSKEFSIQSGTTVYSSIIEYHNTNVVRDNTLINKTSAVATLSSSGPSYTDHIETTIGSYKIRVYYDTNKDMEYSVAFNVLSECVSVYEYFVTDRGFTAPIPYDNTAYYAVYLVDDDYMTSNGRTEPQSGKSRIMIHYSVASSSASNYKRTISHEFSHAVMMAYGISSISSNLWFHESFASMSALVYCGSSNYWFNGVISDYLSHSYKSIYSTDSDYHIYGALVYPLYIHTYLGGWAAIKDIYSKFASAGNGYDAITDSVYISDYRFAFLASVTRNYKPINYYTYATAAWGTGSINDQTFPFASSTNMGVSPMACHYQRFSSSSDIGTAYFTIEITSSNSSGMMLNKITETSTNTLSISTVSTSFTRITVQQANFGLTIKKLTLIPVNTNSSGAAINYKLTASN